jgi:predicted flap endonuclease-1-like 5' DNA nuclease
MSEQPEQILAVFVLDDDVAARRFLKAVEKIDDVDDNVRIVDAAFADRTRRGRVKVQQTTGHGRGRSTGIGVVVGAILAGPAGAMVGGAAGGILAGMHNRLNEIGVTEKFMREVAGEVEKGKSALFVLYEGDWSASIGLIGKEVTAEHALLIQSTLPLATATALRQLVEPAVEELGGEEIVADYEVEMVAEATDAAAVPAAEAEASTIGDDLTNISGLGPKSAAVLAAAGVDGYARLAATSEPDLRRILTDAHATVPRNVSTWSMQAAFAAKGDWRGLARYDQMQSQQGAAAAKPKGMAAEPSAPPAETDDLTQLSGIGPRMASILAEGGVTSYEQLQHTSTDDLRRIVSAAGVLPPSSLDTWATQASYAGNGDWRGLAEYNKRH